MTSLKKVTNLFVEHPVVEARTLFDAHYRGLILKASGVVDRIEVTGDGKPVVYLLDRDKVSIIAFFGRLNTDGLSSLKNGDRIAMSGKLTNAGSNTVVFSSCQLLEELDSQEREGQPVTVGKKGHRLRFNSIGRFVVGSATVIAAAIAFIAYLKPPTSSVAVVNQVYSFPKADENATSTANIGDILAKHSSYSTSLEQQDFLDKYRNLQVQGTGAFIDTFELVSSYVVVLSVAHERVACELAKVPNIKGKLLLGKGKAFSFYGEFLGTTSYSGYLAYTVRNCSLLE